MILSITDPGVRRCGACVIVFASLLVVSGCGGKEEELGGKKEAEGPTSVEALAEERERLDATVFANEREAQRYEQVFVKLSYLFRP